MTNRASPRAVTIKILEMAASGSLDPLAALRSALTYMSEAEVEDLAHSEGWVEDDEDDEADEAEDDEADEAEDEKADEAEDGEADEAEDDEEAWHAYRWPTPEEIHRGRSEWDVVLLGWSPSEEGAIGLLPRKDGQPFGQIQKGKLGPISNL